MPQLQGHKALSTSMSILTGVCTMTTLAPVVETLQGVLVAAMATLAHSWPSGMHKILHLMKAYKPTVAVAVPRSVQPWHRLHQQGAISPLTHISGGLPPSVVGW